MSLRHDVDRSGERAERAPELLPTTVALAGARLWVPERDGDLSVAERAYLASGRVYRRSGPAGCGSAGPLSPPSWRWP
ncbi:hypothetical protein STANM309S_00807 [Streptomyces tanashiensis]